MEEPEPHRMRTPAETAGPREQTTPDMDQKRMILATVAVTLLAAEALPHESHRRKCHISQYKALLPSQLRAVQELRDKYEMMPLIIHRCSRKLLRQRPSVLHFTVHDRLILVEKKVALAVHVLRNISNPELSEYVSKPLEMMVNIRADMRHCANSRANGSRTSQHLDKWLQKFNKDKEMEPPECLEENVILNLLQILNVDVKCTAYMEQCDELVQHLSLPP